MFKGTSIAEGDGKLFLSAEGSIVDFSVSFEALVEVPSIEIYGKHVSEFVEFQNFLGRTSAVFFGDAKRFELEHAAGIINPCIDRHGWIKAHSRWISARVETSSVLVNEHRGIVICFWIVDISDYCLNYHLGGRLDSRLGSRSIVPEGLPTFWGPIATLLVNLWQQERKLFAIGLVTFAVSIAASYYFKFYTIAPRLIPTPAPTTPLIIPGH